MARTAKWEHKSDTYSVGQRLERKARPAGRDAILAEQNLAEWDAE